MAKVTFFPLGNGDSCFTELDDERLILIDYRDQKDRDDENDKRIDLPDALHAILDDKERDTIDVVAFTHADADHVAGSDEFFYLEHAEKYQSDERIRIGELWVPAAMVLESGLTGSARTMRQEARHRLKEGKGIRVFSEPSQLDDWLEEQAIKPKDRKNLITTAGSLVPGFTESRGSVEIFVHSPFSFRFEDDEEDRNNNSLVLHFTFFAGDREVRLMLGGDAEYEAWRDIVLKTEQKERTDRLEWDAFKISHHCSYTALSSEKGKSRTKPIEEVARLLEKGAEGSLIISSSLPIDCDKTPPHKQAAAYYRDVVGDPDNDFIVTMEHPDEENPKPVEIEITSRGLKHKKTKSFWVGASGAIATRSPRFGII